MKGVLSTVKSLADSEIQFKVRVATSNKEPGLPKDLMRDISRATNDPKLYTDIMDMIWRRINDSGKNYRHVYKGLVLLEYCIAFGAEKVAEEARARIIQIKTLREFHHIDETGRDQGVKVREEAKRVLGLLASDNPKSAANAMPEMANMATAAYSPAVSAPGGGGAYGGRFGGTPVHESDEERQMARALEESRRVAAQHEAQLAQQDADLRRALELSAHDAALDPRNYASSPVPGVSGGGEHRRKRSQSSPVKPSSVHADLLDLAGPTIYEMPQQQPPQMHPSNSFNSTYQQPYQQGYTQAVMPSSLYGQSQYSASSGGYNGQNQAFPQQSEGFPSAYNSQQPPIDAYAYSNSVSASNPFGAAPSSSSGMSAPSSGLGMMVPNAQQGGPGHTGFGGAFDGHMAPKLMPHQQGTDEANIRLADVARNSPQIDPFANLARERAQKQGVPVPQPQNPGFVDARSSPAAIGRNVLVDFDNIRPSGNRASGTANLSVGASPEPSRAALNKYEWVEDRPQPRSLAEMQQGNPVRTPPTSAQSYIGSTVPSFTGAASPALPPRQQQSFSDPFQAAFNPSPSFHPQQLQPPGYPGQVPGLLVQQPSQAGFPPQQPTAYPPVNPSQPNYGNPF